MIKAVKLLHISTNESATHFNLNITCIENHKYAWRFMVFDINYYIKTADVSITLTLLAALNIQ